MKLASFRVQGGHRFGVVRDGYIVDLTGKIGGASALSELLALSDWQEKARRADGEKIALGQVEFLPVNPSPDAKILALGWAYRDHAAETNHAATEHPMFFTKFPQALAGHGQEIKKPAISEMFDFEGEIAVVVGRSAHRVSEAEALDYVAGYTILMDGSIRDWQKHSVTAGKNFDALTPVGPWMITADAAPPHDEFQLETRLNGTVMQRAVSADLIWSIPYLVSYCSTFCRLAPGDIISTGTPGGVGHKRNQQIFMQPGDLIEVEVTGIGILANLIRSEN